MTKILRKNREKRWWPLLTHIYRQVTHTRYAWFGLPVLGFGLLFVINSVRAELGTTLKDNNTSSNSSSPPSAPANDPASNSSAHPQPERNVAQSHEQSNISLTINGQNIPIPAGTNEVHETYTETNGGSTTTTQVGISVKDGQESVSDSNSRTRIRIDANSSSESKVKIKEEVETRD